MFVCGVPKASRTHAYDACLLAIRLQSMVAEFVRQKEVPHVSVKIGIAAGPVIAGVIGISAPKYDVWGYTVNVANRLSQVAMPGTTVVTRDIALLEKEKFRFRLMKNLTFVPGLGKVLLF
jgi:adenylate cyclase